MIIPSKYSSPVLADKYVQYLQEALETLAWIEKVQPAVRVGVDDQGRTFPVVYKNDGSNKNYNILFDTSLKSYAFFEYDGDVTMDDGNFSNEDQTMTIPLAIVVWGRLDKIYPSKNYDYTSELIKDVLDIIKYCVNTSGYRIDGITDISWTTDYNRVFNRYTMHNEADAQAMMRDRTAFRISFTLIVDSSCELEDGTSPIVVSSSFNGIVHVTANQVAGPYASDAQISADVGYTAAEAGSGYSVIIEIDGSNSNVFAVSNGSIWRRFVIYNTMA